MLVKQKGKAIYIIYTKQKIADSSTQYKKSCEN